MSNLEDLGSRLGKAQMKSDVVLCGSPEVEPVGCQPNLSIGRSRIHKGAVAVLIDAGHVEKLGLVDVDALAWDPLLVAMAGHSQLLCALYYDCLPYVSPRATPNELIRFRLRRRRHLRLEQDAGFVVRLGKLEKRVEWDGPDRRVKYVQKRVDMKLGVDLTWMACKGLITHAAVLAGDSDFVPAIEAVRAEGVNVHLYHGPTAHRDLIRACDGHSLIAPSWGGLRFGGGCNAVA